MNRSDPIFLISSSRLRGSERMRNFVFGCFWMSNGNISRMRSLHFEMSGRQIFPIRNSSSLTQSDLLKSSTSCFLDPPLVIDSKSIGLGRTDILSGSYLQADLMYLSMSIILLMFRCLSMTSSKVGSYFQNTLVSITVTLGMCLFSSVKNLVSQGSYSPLR